MTVGLDFDFVSAREISGGTVTGGKNTIALQNSDFKASGQAIVHPLGCACREPKEQMR